MAIGNPRKGFNVVEYNKQKRDRQARENCAKGFDQEPRVMPAGRLSVAGVGRDAGYPASLQFYFDRPATDAEMRFLHECMQRSVALMPHNLK